MADLFSYTIKFTQRILFYASGPHVPAVINFLTYDLDNTFNRVECNGLTTTKQPPIDIFDGEMIRLEIHS